MSMMRWFTAFPTLLYIKHFKRHGSNSSSASHLSRQGRHPSNGDLTSVYTCYRDSQREQRKSALGRGKLRTTFRAARQVDSNSVGSLPSGTLSSQSSEPSSYWGCSSMIPVFCKMRLQRSEGGPQPRLDGPERFPRAFGNFALCESFEVSQFHSNALRLRQSS
jgi:hypothetical protein